MKDAVTVGSASPLGTTISDGAYSLEVWLPPSGPRGWEPIGTGWSTPIGKRWSSPFRRYLEIAKARGAAGSIPRWNRPTMRASGVMRLGCG